VNRAFRPVNPDLTGERDRAAEVGSKAHPGCHCGNPESPQETLRLRIVIRVTDCILKVALSS